MMTSGGGSGPALTLLFVATSWAQISRARARGSLSLSSPSTFQLTTRSEAAARRALAERAGAATAAMPRRADPEGLRQQEMNF